MKGRDVERNAITYNTMPNTMVHCCEMQCAPRILEDMHDESLLMEPDMITYNMIMKSISHLVISTRAFSRSNRWKKEAVSPG